MTAQAGNNILLQYGTQGAQQLGGSVLLTYEQAVGATAVSMRSQARGVWVGSDFAIKPVDAPHAATVREDKSKDAPWSAAIKTDDEGSSSWVGAFRTDGHNDAPWGFFGDMMNEEQRGRWFKSMATDFMGHSSWTVFDEPMNEDRFSVWVGSKAVDADRVGLWQGFLVKSYEAVPYEPPAGLSCNFVVVGGSPMTMQLTGAVADQEFPLTVQFGPELYTPHYLGNPLFNYTPPPCFAADFLVSRFTEIRVATDSDGNIIYKPMSVDPFRLNPWGVSVSADKEADHPWTRYSHPMNPGWGVIVEDNQPPVNEHGTIVTPTLRAYVVLNEITLIRVSNNLPLPALSLSITSDVDSWTFSWSATVPATKLDDVLPASAGEPVELEATINGWNHRLLAEKVVLDRSFGKERVNISGRGIAAKLAAPYLASETRTNSIGRNAAQLCDDALLINGTPASGWVIDFNLTDWLVPANAWMHTGTPMDAINAIANAGGGYVRASETEKILHIEPRYPVVPWEWGTATPDFELPSAATTKVGVEWLENPAYNVVYVSGTGVGAVLGQVKRTGSAGDIAAPMVTDQLITHAYAARQKGISILGSAGVGQRLTLETPIIENIGPYPVGSLIEFTEGLTSRIGLVRSNSITAGIPRTRQTLEVECHG
jgi:hypothetical protein